MVFAFPIKGTRAQDRKPGAGFLDADAKVKVLGAGRGSSPFSHVADSRDEKFLALILCPQ